MASQGVESCCCLANGSLEIVALVERVCRGEMGTAGRYIKSIIYAGKVESIIYS
jgi:hypothetical protein